MQQGGLCHRPLAAGQDRLLRLRPESGAHSRRDRLCRHCRSRGEPDPPLSGRRAGGGKRRPGGELPGSGRAARDEAGRDHRAGRAWPRCRHDDAVDLRSFVRLREDQRRIPQLIGGGRMKPERYLEVAAAVLQKPDGSFLLARRPEGKPYAGYWEFPGGKIEPGETAAQALVRELHEELGIVADRYTPWITREFVYPHAHVRLHFFRVNGWRGEIRDIHHDALAWKTADKVDVEPMLPANVAVLRGLTL